jgi:hypothetical protein
MQKLIFLISGFILLFTNMHSASAWRDTCYISNTRITPNVKSKGILGLKIEFVSNLIYDPRHKSQEPNYLILEVALLNEAGKPLPAHGDGSSFNLKGFAGAEKTELSASVRQKVSRTFFIPYYCLDLPAGSAKLQCTVRVSLKDSSLLEKPRMIAVKGVNLQTVSIDKPGTTKLRMLCSGVRVSATDHGKSWDFGLTGLPDPVFKVILDNAVQPDFVYTSTEMQNALSAAWIDYSTVFFVSDGDPITLGIYDKDTLIDDLIGKETHTVDEWLEISKTSKELVFGQVTYCTVKVEKMK